MDFCFKTSRFCQDTLMTFERCLGKVLHVNVILSFRGTSHLLLAGAAPGCGRLPGDERRPNGACSGECRCNTAEIQIGGSPRSERPFQRGNGSIRTKTARYLNLGVSRNRFGDFLADPDSRSFSRFTLILTGAGALSPRRSGWKNRQRCWWWGCEWGCRSAALAWHCRCKV
jgi:hypothetical protein